MFYEVRRSRGFFTERLWSQLIRASLLGTTIFAPPAYAQRADENATAAAEDAFGTRVGNESVGLYTANSARGFSPQQAGNMRIEGLYYDQQGLFGNRMQRSQSMRIGLSAQSYPFPAPTGIADISIVMPMGNRRVVSVAQHVTYPVGGSQPSADFITPIIEDKLGFAGGVAYLFGPNDSHSAYDNLGLGGVLRWTPNDAVEVIPLAYYSRSTLETQPLVIPGGAFLPERIDRSVFFGQHWARRESKDRTFGLITRSKLSDTWKLQFGIFDSDNERPENYAVLYRNVQRNGDALLDVVGSPHHVSAGTSGEVRLSGVLTQGVYRHTLYLATRGRNTHRIFGGTSTASYGAAQIGIYRELPKHSVPYSVRDDDVVRQITPGVSYAGQWAGVGEFSIGVQKSFYRREYGKENATPLETQSEPWLYNATVAVNPTARFALYAGYTRGLEEFGTAPETAANRGQPVPAALTEQIDAGLRYRFKPGLSLIAGVFEISKPYFDRDQSNIYTNVGALRHRGVEMSLTGQIMPGLTVVAGTLLLRARASGLSVDRGLVGPVPPGLPPAKYLANVQYAFPALPSLALDTQVNIDESHYANRVNTFRIPTAVTWDIGARYSFGVWGTRANLRFQVRNLTNAYNWTVDGASGRVAPTAPRRAFIRLAADY
jgi:iron complex outermembrane receptor protein